jgi:hypothetical protein
VRLGAAAQCIGWQPRQRVQLSPPRRNAGCPAALTLVVLNTVKAARAVFVALRGDGAVHLLHSGSGRWNRRNLSEGPRSQVMVIGD